MSTQPAAGLNLPTEAEAHGVILHYAKQAFFHRLAQHDSRLAPQNAQEENSLFELGLKLASVQEPAQPQQQPGNRFGAALSHLDQALGLDKVASDNEAAAFALHLAADPAVYTSALVVKQAQQQPVAAA